MARHAFNDLSSLDHDGVAVVSENTVGPRYVMRELGAFGSAVVSVQEDVVACLYPSRCAYVPIEVSFVAHLRALERP